MFEVVLYILIMLLPNEIMPENKSIELSTAGAREFDRRLRLSLRDTLTLPSFSLYFICQLACALLFVSISSPCVDTRRMLFRGYRAAEKIEIKDFLLICFKRNTVY